MKEKQLTIAIPAYNSENFIRKCLDSFITEQADGSFAPDDRLQIIVINDGSTDGTESIVKEYVEKYPATISLISKENGGHGSGINAAIEAAEGKYFKAVDADDRVIKENLTAILDELEKTESDVVVTGYKSENEGSGRVQTYSTKGDYNGRTLDMKEFSEIFDSIPASFQYHGLAYRTDFYRSLELYLSEGVFYEDQEYAIVPFAKAETISIIPYDLYVYRLGGNEQSISYVNLQNRLGDLKAVLKRLIDRYNLERKADTWDEDRELFFKKRLGIALNSYFAITFVKTQNKKAGRKESAGFMQFIEANNMELAEFIRPKYEVLERASKVPGLAAFYSKLADSALYHKIKKIWLR